MPPELKEKLKALREYWFDDDMSLKWVKEVELKLRKILVLEKLAQNRGAVAIVKDAKERVRIIDMMLTLNEDLTEIERRLLFREKKVHNFYLNRFDGKPLEQQFDMVGKLLDEELSDAGLEVGGKK